LKGETIVTDRMNYILDGAIISQTANEWEIKSGEIGTVEDMKKELQAKMRDYFMNKCFNALTAVWTAANTPLNYINAGGALTAVVLEKANNRINQTTGGAKTIIGTRNALTPLMHFGAFWPPVAGGLAWGVNSQLEEVMKTGWLGTFLGANVIAVQQEYDNPEDYNALLDATKVLVIGEHVGEFITYGGFNNQEYTDMRVVPPQWNYSLFTQFGMIIDNAMGIYVIDGLV